MIIGKYYKDSVWAECLRLYDKKNVQNTDPVVCEQCLKWNHLSCTFLKKLPKSCKMKYIKYNLKTRSFVNKTCPQYQVCTPKH